MPYDVVNSLTIGDDRSSSKKTFTVGKCPEDDLVVRRS